MNKTLLTLLAAAVSLGMSATPVRHANSQVSKISEAEIAADHNLVMADFDAASGPQKADATAISYSVCGDPASFFSIGVQGKGKQIAAAFEMTPEVSTKFAGNTVNSISFYSGMMTNGYSQSANKIFVGTAFICEGDMTNEPLVTRAGTLNQLTAQGAGYNTITFPTPVTIEAGKRYFIGYYFTLANDDPTYTDYPLVIDAIKYPAGKDQGGWVASRNSKDDPWSAWEWDNISTSYGNTYIVAIIKGENLPKNGAMVSGVYPDMSACAGSPFEVEVDFTNTAVNSITNVEYTYQIGNDEAKTATAAVQSVNYGEDTYFIISDAKASTASATPTEIKVTITKVNGADNIETEATGLGVIDILPAGKGYDRNVVIEEATSIGCGYCPYGAMALDYIGKTYTDGTYTPIAVHSKFGTTADPMETSTYAEFLNTYISGFPQAAINRFFVTGFGSGQDNAYMDAYYQAMRSYPAPVKVEAECEWTEDKNAIIFNTTTSCVWDYAGNNPYRLSYVFTEDNVGPYDQLSYLSGGQTTSKIMFEHVARKLDTFAGIDGSIPADIEADKAYSYNRTVTLPAKYGKKENINAIVMVVNTTNGVIENVAYIPAADIKGGESSICDVEVEADQNAPAEYFNLQGVRVENPGQGLYIKRQGNKVSKVIL